MWRKILLFLSLLCCCAATPKYPPPRITIGLDLEELSAAQRRVVREAENSWYRQTRGCIVFEDGGDIVVRSMLPADKYDDTQAGAYVLGMTSYHQVEIAFSRIQNLDQAIIVSAHELGHVIGLHHNTGKNSLMNAVNSSNTRLNLSDEDRSDLEKLTGCHL